MAHDRHYCPECGTALTTKEAEGRDRQFCPSCQRVLYRNPKPCAGVIVVDGESILLVKRTEPPAVGAWSLPAGYLEADEPPEQAAVRELCEETTLEVKTDELTLIDTVFVKHPTGKHVLVIVYATPRSAVGGKPQAGSDAAAASFWRMSEILDSESERLEPGYLETFCRARESVLER
ncbi:NUDIX domain-containing protein [Halomarina rubra]|uniref:NUDIX domain-containing protein n=1 Tax=Halomarina rubra TaxID=2071873 RepID=A0ABD6AX39_9EURY